LRNAIYNRRLPVGGALPSERELGEVYALSRVTIRKAIDKLVDEGLLERRKGREPSSAARRLRHRAAWKRVF
jgi:GntR family transcriptional regulator